MEDNTTAPATTPFAPASVATTRMSASTTRSSQFSGSDATVNENSPASLSTHSAVSTSSTVPVDNITDPEMLLSSNPAAYYTTSSRGHGVRPQLMISYCLFSNGNAISISPDMARYIRTTDPALNKGVRRFVSKVIKKWFDKRYINTHPKTNDEQSWEDFFDEWIGEQLDKFVYRNRTRHPEYSNIKALRVSSEDYDMFRDTWNSHPPVEPRLVYSPTAVEESGLLSPSLNSSASRAQSTGEFVRNWFRRELDE